MECYTYLRNVTDLLSDGKTPYERRFGKPFEGPIIPFGSLVEYHPITAKDQSRIHQFGKKVLPGLFLGYALYAGGMWKGDVLIADLEELETMDASEIYSKRLNAKEVIFPQKGEFTFPIADGRIKTLGEDQELRTSTLIRPRPIQGEGPIHMSIAEKSGRPERDSDLRCQSGPSAKNSVIPSEGDSSKNHGADQQRLQISDLHFDKFPTPATFACWKMRFKTEVCTCSQFPTEAIQWIKEVELVDSVDELRSSSFIRGIAMPNFEVLDARIATALNKIIHSSHFKRRISLEEQKAQKQDRFLQGRQIAYLIYEYFRVIGANDSVENYTDLFTIVLRNDDIQEFDPKWMGRNSIIDDANPI